MATLMFWNVARKALSPHLCEACNQYDVDILITAEHDEEQAAVIAELNTNQPQQPYSEIYPGLSQVRLFSRLPASSFTAIFDDGRVTVRALKYPSGAQVTLVGAHLPSKLQATEEDQYYKSRQVRREIAKAEMIVRHNNTVIVGDLNMSPFERAMVAADGFHAHMDRATACRQARIVKGESWDFFYNPMWSLLGDASSGPPGSYYRNSGGSVVNFYWSMFDQVLLRPGLLPYFDNKSLKIVTDIASTSLLRNGIINKKYSDHLPLVFKLDLERMA